MATNTANLGFVKPALTDAANITATNVNWDAVDESLTDKTMERTTADSNGIYTVVTYKREDTTKFSDSTLSGGTSPNYTTRTVRYYAANGSTVTRTIVYTLSYSGEDLISEVIQ